VTGEFDVAVVGAGPAGCAAAITLARGGAHVVLVDRAHFPRDKCCGDGLTTAATRRLEALGFDPGAVASFRPAKELALRSPSGRTVLLPLGQGPGVFAAVARRRELDNALADLARRAGARFVDATRLVALTTTRDGSVRLNFAGGDEATARYVVAADGAWSPIRRMLTPPGPPAAARRPEWIAFRAYVDHVRSVAAERLWVWFRADLLPGYAWSFPLADGAVNLGVCLPQHSGAGLAERWEETLASPFFTSLLGPDAVLAAPARAWPIPAGVGRVGLSGLGNRVLFVGDAACAADPFTGEGIEQALATGTLAAQAIASAASSPETVASSYGDAVRRSIGRDHRVSTWCRGLFETSLGAKSALRLVDSSDFSRRNVARWLFGDYPRAIVTNPRPWARFGRRSPGAFADSDVA
jgi:geranylgeranyl reductase family protein